LSAGRGKKSEGEQQKTHSRCKAAELLGNWKRHLSYLSKRVTGRNPERRYGSGFNPWSMLSRTAVFHRGWLRRHRRVLFGHTSTVSAVVQESPKAGPLVVWQWK